MASKRAKGGLKKSPQFADAAKRRMAKNVGRMQAPIDEQWGGDVQYTPFDLAGALSHMEERQALAGLDETNRYSNFGHDAGLGGAGGGVVGGENATQAILNNMPRADDNLPISFRNTPLGRKVIRDGWSLSPEDKRALEVIIADQLKSGGQF